MSIASSRKHKTPQQVEDENQVSWERLSAAQGNYNAAT